MVKTFVAHGPLVVHNVGKLSSFFSTIFQHCILYSYFNHRRASTYASNGIKTKVSEIS